MLRIQSPAFTETRNSSKRTDLPESRQHLVLDLQRDLEMMSWYGLVINQRSQFELRHPFLAQRNLENPRTGSIRRRRGIVRRRVGLAKLRERLRDDRRLRRFVEQELGTALSVAQDLLDVGHDRLPAFVVERIRQILPQLRNPLVDRTLAPAKLAKRSVHVLLDLRHLLQSHLVNLIRRQAGAGVLSQEVCVRLGASLEAPEPRVVISARKLRL